MLTLIKLKAQNWTAGFEATRQEGPISATWPKLAPYLNLNLEIPPVFKNEGGQAPALMPTQL